MNTDTLTRLSKAVPTKLRKRLEPTIHDEFILAFERLAPEELRLGQSRAGGVPDLPDSLEHPAGLQFLCQINLAEVPPTPGTSLLPSEGMLYFFYDMEDQPWGFDPAHKGRWAVLHADTTSGLRARPGASKTNPHQIRFTVERRLTDPEFAPETFSMKEVDAYRDALEDISAPGFNKLMGFPDPLANGIRELCELASHGVNAGQETWRDDPVAAVLLEYPDDWRLLLQLDSETPMGWMWGDCGRLHIMIPAPALERRDFSKAWVVLQCA